jgi:hypothetical protein
VHNYYYATLTPFIDLRFRKNNVSAANGETEILPTISGHDNKAFTKDTFISTDNLITPNAPPLPEDPKKELHFNMEINTKTPECKPDNIYPVVVVNEKNEITKF